MFLHRIGVRSMACVSALQCPYMFVCVLQQSTASRRYYRFPFISSDFSRSRHNARIGFVPARKEFATRTLSALEQRSHAQADQAGRSTAIRRTDFM